LIHLVETSPQFMHGKKTIISVYLFAFIYDNQLLIDGRTVLLCLRNEREGLRFKNTVSGQWVDTCPKN